MDVMNTLHAYINATNTHDFEQVKKYLSIAKAHIEGNS